MSQKYEQNMEVGDYYQDRGMRIDTRLRRFPTKEDLNALNFHLLLAAEIVSKYIEDTPNE